VCNHSRGGHLEYMARKQNLSIDEKRITTCPWTRYLGKFVRPYHPNVMKIKGCIRISTQVCALGD